MSDNVTVYCDESGNDGPNYLNPQQPFYVLAGWAVPDGRMVDATLAVERTRVSQVPDAAELKFKTFKKSEGKREAVISLVCELGEIGFAVDEEARQMGVSNRAPALLEKCISMLETDEADQLAKSVLERYTGKQFESAAECRRWLDAEGSTLHFDEARGIFVRIDKGE